MLTLQNSTWLPALIILIRTKYPKIFEEETNPKKYNCPLCNKSDLLVGNGDLHAHILEWHGQNALTEFRLERVPDVQDEKCSECGFYFHHMVDHDCDENLELINDLNEAENSVSEPVTFYPCPECGESFQVENGVLYTHLINAHGITAWLQFRNGL